MRSPKIAVVTMVDLDGTRVRLVVTGPLTVDSRSAQHAPTGFPTGDVRPFRPPAQRACPPGKRSTPTSRSTMDPFDDPHAEVRVVIDSHGHPCLWPAACPVPFGWTTALCPAPREEAQSYLDCHRSTRVLDDDARSPVH